MNMRENISTASVESLFNEKEHNLYGSRETLQSASLHGSLQTINNIVNKEYLNGLKLELRQRYELQDKSFVVIHIISLINENKDIFANVKGFMRLMLYPVRDKKEKLFKTAIFRNKNIVEINEVFRFFLQPNECHFRWLLIQLIALTRKNDKVIVGESYVTITENTMMSPTQTVLFQPKKKPTMPIYPVMQYQGHLYIAIKYATGKTISIKTIHDLKPADQLQVWIKQAKNLCSPKINVPCSAFCKIWLQSPLDTILNESSQMLVPIETDHGGGTHKAVVTTTRCIPHTNDPEWNVILKFDRVNRQKLRSQSLELHILHRSRCCAEQRFCCYVRPMRTCIVGGVRLNLGPVEGGGPWMDATSHECLLWHEMLVRPDVWVDGVLEIRPDLF